MTEDEYDDDVDDVGNAYHTGIAIGTMLVNHADSDELAEFIQALRPDESAGALIWACAALATLVASTAPTLSRADAWTAYAYATNPDYAQPTEEA